MMIMSMETKLDKIQFLHYPMTNSKSVLEQWLRNPKLVDLENFAEFPKKAEFPDKSKLPAKRGFELTETRKEDSIPPANPGS